MPDQAAVGTGANSNNPQNQTSDLGRTTLPSHEADTGNVETYWPCVGAERVVPDFISLFPGSGEVAPFAGATRHLCDRKEVALTDQSSALAKFYIFTETHTASHFTGVITDDFTAEFDPFSPQFVRSTDRLICPCPSRTGPAMKLTACTRMRGAPTTASTTPPGK